MMPSGSASDAARSADRKEKVGSGDRSERIRTYNFPQGRVTDHRINLTLYKLPQVISGEGAGRTDRRAHDRAPGRAARRARRGGVSQPDKRAATSRGRPSSRARAHCARIQVCRIESAELDARMLVGAASDLDLTGLITAAQPQLTPEEAARLEAFAHRRVAGEPVARILGQKEFWGLPLKLSAETLVPRPDTETVVELALEISAPLAPSPAAHR